MLTLADKAALALRLVREAKVIAFDTETSGLDWRTCTPVGWVVSGEGHSVYVPTRHTGGGNLSDPAGDKPSTGLAPAPPTRFEKELAKAFADRARLGLLTVGHHLKFDMHFAANVGVLLGGPLEDTSIDESLLDEHAGHYSLGACAVRHGVTAKKGEELYQHLANKFGGPANRDQMKNFHRLAGNDPKGVEYAEGDGVTTLELRAAQIARRDLAWPMLKTVWQLEADLIRTVWRIERRGFKIDLEKANETKSALLKQIEEGKSHLPPGFNTRSSTDLKALCEAAGRTDWPMTAPSKRFPKGQPSFVAKWMNTFPEGARVIEIKESENLINSFIDPLVTRHALGGRVHPTLHQVAQDDYGTIAGRFSCSDPNLQQVPKHNEKLGRLFRVLFIPDEGYVLTEADYSQCEPRLFAHYSEEPVLVEGYNSTPPRDMHRVVAEMLHVDRNTVAKRMNMGLLTGMQLKTFSEHMGTSIEEIRPHFDAWMRLLPGIPEFQQTAKNLMKRRGYVQTLLGRVCRLDNPQFAYKATSRVIQGGNADIVKYKLLQADRFLESEGDQVQLLMTIHDSYVWQEPDNPEGKRIAGEMVRMMRDVQSDPFNLLVPFKLDVGSGRNWSEATYDSEK